MTMTFLLVALGGALGAVLRYAATLVVAAPLGTALVNVIGCFVIGAVWVALEQRGLSRLAPLVITGVLGGFTTFSAFALDTMRLMADGRHGVAAAYVLGSVSLCLVGCAAGLTWARTA